MVSLLSGILNEMGHVLFITSGFLRCSQVVKNRDGVIGGNSWALMNIAADAL